MIDVVDAYFESQGWPLDRHDTLPVRRFRYANDDGEWLCFVRVVPDVGHVVVYSVVQEPTPPERVPAVLELLNRANHGLDIGNFELDPDTGEVRFRAGLDVRQGTLSEELLDPLVKSNLVCMGACLSAIRAVQDGRQLPADAFREVVRRQGEIDFLFES